MENKAFQQELYNPISYKALLEKRLFVHMFLFDQLLNANKTQLTFMEKLLPDC